MSKQIMSKRYRKGFDEALAKEKKRFDAEIRKIYETNKKEQEKAAERSKDITIPIQAVINRWEKEMSAASQKYNRAYSEASVRSYRRMEKIEKKFAIKKRKT